MAPSLRVVVRRMGLRPLAGSLDAVVRWVAVSELEDPTPFLEGDELLLTTGMRLTNEPGHCARYVDRLVARGVAGLGFGVGLSHEHLPAALIRAASAAGLPLLEVPRETPFIAIGKVVSELLAAEQYEEITRAFAAQGRLTRAALLPDGMAAVIDRLAKEVGGWAALLDEGGEVRHATPGAPVETVAAELTRLRTPAGARADRSRGVLPSSLAISAPGEHVIVQPLGARPRGFFAVGAAEGFSPVTHTVINAAGSLLTLALEQGGARLAAERRVRSAALELLLAGDPEGARAALAPLGGHLPDEPLVVLALPEEAVEVVEPHAFAALLGPSGRAGASPGGGGGPARRAGRGGTVVAVVAENSADELVEEVARPVGAPTGMSGTCAYQDLGSGLDQARRALDAALAAGGGVVRFADLAGQGLLRLLDPAAARAFSTALLAPLVRHGSRADLVESLRAYLACNGHWDAAAQRLGVHRHTLRYRMRRVAELLGRDLDEPGVRAELWIALAAAPAPPAT